MVMNMITTAAMVKTGKVYENMMINLKPTNKKLRERMIGIVIDITDDTVIVEFGNNKNCRIPMEKSAITRVEKPGEA